MRRLMHLGHHITGPMASTDATNRLWTAVFENYPIAEGLDGFRASFRSAQQVARNSDTAAILRDLEPDRLQDLAFTLLLALQALPAARILRASNGKSLLVEITRLGSAVAAGDVDLDRLHPLLKASVDRADDSTIWNQVKIAVTETTPPPSTIASSVHQTPWVRNTSSFANSSEYRKHVDDILKEELGLIYVGLPKFWDTYFGGIDDLETASEAFFNQCKSGPSPIFEDGWTTWPTDAKEENVLGWIAVFYEMLSTFAADWRPTPAHRRRLLAKPNMPIDGSVGKRKLDIGFVSDPKARKDSKFHWSQVLVPGELKSNPSADKAAEAWLDIGRYAREVLAAQDTRRFVLGFTICGSLMRVWAFDRLGGIAAEQFDINKDGFRFIHVILGFSWMSEEELGFDPTIRTTNQERFIEIERDGGKERVIIDGLILRARGIASRATTCWLGHPEGHPEVSLVIKDSWQYPERDEEGEMLSAVADNGVVNVARYHHHETVQVRGINDDIQNNIRQGLDMATASDYQPGRAQKSRKTPPEGPLRGRNSTSGKRPSSHSRKRPSSQTDSALPPKKRSCSASSSTKVAAVQPNRVHRRVIVKDYGKAIYKASSRRALLAGLEGCIKGYESLHRAGVLHRDISINNLMINEDQDNPSWPSFLIDLDLAIRVERVRASGAKSKTGTRAFMAIGALLGEQHSFMHDLESFFWVLFWICIHYGANGKYIGPTEFDSWNYERDNQLARSKLGAVSDESIFLKIVDENFTTHYQPLISCVNQLRREVFPNGSRWKKAEPTLYTSMMRILHNAQKGSVVQADA